jgi:hypothetical protein
LNLAKSREFLEGWPIPDIFRYRNQELNTLLEYLDSVSNVNIETLDDLKHALAESGYSDKAITEILKWYKITHEASS